MSRISRKFAASQIRLFEKRPGFVDDDFTVEQLVQAYQNTCDTEARALQITEYLAHKLRFAPLPVDIYEASDHLAELRRFDEPQNSFPAIALRLLPPEVRARWNATGGSEGPLFSGATDETIEKFRKQAIHSKDKFVRKLAAAIVADYEKRNPPR